MLQPEVFTAEMAITPFFRLAFRPFFLLPALLSVVFLLIWLAVLNGIMLWPGSIAVNN